MHTILTDPSHDFLKDERLLEVAASRHLRSEKADLRFAALQKFMQIHAGIIRDRISLERGNACETLLIHIALLDTLKHDRRLQKRAESWLYRVLHGRCCFLRKTTEECEIDRGA